MTLLGMVAVLLPGSRSAAQDGLPASSVLSRTRLVILNVVELPHVTPVAEVAAGSPPAPKPTPVVHPVLLPHSVPVTPPSAPAASGSTLETVYAEWSGTCWDSTGAHTMVRPTRIFVAMRGVTCGTLVTITGPAGSITAPIWDHGPNCPCPERGIDASADVFTATVGRLGQGIGRVSWAFG